MMSSQTITLFTKEPRPGRGPSSFLVSMVAHGIVLGLVYLGIRQTPRNYGQIVSKQYTVRFMDLHRDTSQVRRPGLVNPALDTVSHAATPGGSQREQRSLLPQFAGSVLAPQTLVQPDLPKLSLLHKIPLPTVVLWSAQNEPARKIVPPAPPQATADISPALDPPDQELNLEDRKISPTTFPSDALVIPPSTTSPLVVHGQDAIKRAPEMPSKQTEPPAPAPVVSISDLQLKQGTIALPPANETAASSNGAAVQGQSLNSTQGKDGDPVGSHSDAGTGQQSEEHVLAASRGITRQGDVKGSVEISDSQSEEETDGSVTRITLPKTGQFGFVVVGCSLAEEYPEAAGVLTDRSAYTVSLHVGLKRNWTLQYSLPRSVQAVSRLEAPWPYEIVRPNMAPSELNADALMVRGMINQAGRFEMLTVVFPPQYAQAQFILSALQQWRFRPALQNGRPTAVEVLLIIPNELQ
jgi:hypothetical protein